jgi:hypothetical protein
VNIRSLTRGDGAVIAAAVLLLIASFLPFFTAGNYSWNSWHPAFFPLLPTVHLAALAVAGLILAARTQPAEKRVLGLGFQQWATALAVFVGWSALWSMFANVNPEGSNEGLSLGAGAWLTLIFALALTVLAVLSQTLPALKVPLISDKAPQAPLGYGYPGVGQQQPGVGGYGYPGAGQQPQPYGAQQADPAAQQVAQAPTQLSGQSPVAPAAEFASFWFAVPAPRPLYAEDGSATQIAELTPGTWYLAVDQRGAALVAQTQDGRRGVLQDASGIQRG